MSQEKFWVLLSKKLSNEASVAELKELEMQIMLHPEWQYAIQNLEDLWKHQPLEDTLQDEDAYMLHLHRMTEMNIPFEDRPADVPATKVRRIKWYWAAAATIILFVSAFIFLGTSKKSEEKEPAIAQVNEVSTRPGSKTRVQLPDGTIVWLNAGSKLTYNKEFGTGLREVTLTGEGYFDVVKMKEKPFIIHTSTINIKVLGTVFNVKAYPEDKRTEASLIRGSIEVTIKERPNDKIILSPSEKIVVENSTVIEKGKSSVNNEIAAGDVEFKTLMSVNKLKYSERDSSVAETQWVNNKLVFRDESFAELAVKMERWYNVEIEIQDEVLQQKRFSGIFENETIRQAMDALKMLVPFTYNQSGNKIIIHP